MSGGGEDRKIGIDPNVTLEVQLKDLANDGLVGEVKTSLRWLSFLIYKGRKSGSFLNEMRKPKLAPSDFLSEHTSLSVLGGNVEKLVECPGNNTHRTFWEEGHGERRV